MKTIQHTSSLQANNEKGGILEGWEDLYKVMNKEDRKKARKIMAHLELPVELQKKLEEEDKKT